MTTAKIAQCPLCKGAGTVNHAMICPRYDGDGILDEKVIAAEHQGGLRAPGSHSSAQSELTE